MNRRHFLELGLAGAAAMALPAAAQPRLRAVAFDGLALFDPRPVQAVAEALFPGSGSRLLATWRTRQFEYTWLRTLSGNYADFMQVTQDALVFACKLEQLSLTDPARQRLMQAFLELTAWPDVAPVLARLRKQGLKLAPLANFTPAMMDNAITHSGLQGVFDHVLSTDRARAFKPDPRAYQMAVDAFGASKEEIAYVAFAGWDAAGAASFGFPTIWINRMNLPAEELGARPGVIGATFYDVLAFTGTS